MSIYSNKITNIFSIKFVSDVTQKTRFLEIFVCKFHIATAPLSPLKIGRHLWATPNYPQNFLIILLNEFFILNLFSTILEIYLPSAFTKNERNWRKKKKNLIQSCPYFKSSLRSTQCLSFHFSKLILKQRKIEKDFFLYYNALLFFAFCADNNEAWNWLRKKKTYFILNTFQFSGDLLENCCVEYKNR